MPLTASEQRGFLLFGIGLVLLMTLVAWLNVNERDQGQGFPSSYNTQPYGAKAAYLLLEKNGYTVERWNKAPAELPVNSSGTTLVVAGPEFYPHSGEMGGLVRFVLHGGTLLVAGARPNSFIPQSSAESGDARIGFAECKPVALTSLTRGGPISQDGNLIWDFDKDARPVHFLVHFKDQDDKPVVISYTLGQGRVVWWASALPLTNAGIRNRGNLDLLLNTIGDNRHVLWDEYYHEAHENGSAHFSHPEQVWALAQAGFLGLLVILTFSRRSGPIVPLRRESRLSPLEFVETLGSVFQRARGTQVAVEIAFNRFQQIAARRLGIPGSATASDILLAMSKRGIKLPQDAAVWVSRSDEASRDTELTEKNALEYVRALNQAALLLEPPAMAAQPNHEK